MDNLELEIKLSPNLSDENAFKEASKILESKRDEGVYVGAKLSDIFNDYDYDSETGDFIFYINESAMKKDHNKKKGMSDVPKFNPEENSAAIVGFGFYVIKAGEDNQLRFISGPFQNPQDARDELVNIAKKRGDDMKDLNVVYSPDGIFTQQYLTFDTLSGDKKMFSATDKGVEFNLKELLRKYGIDYSKSNDNSKIYLEVGKLKAGKVKEITDEIRETLKLPMHYDGDLKVIVIEAPESKKFATRMFSESGFYVYNKVSKSLVSGPYQSPGEAWKAVTDKEAEYPVYSDDGVEPTYKFDEFYGRDESKSYSEVDVNIPFKVATYGDSTKEYKYLDSLNEAKWKSLSQEFTRNGFDLRYDVDDDTYIVRDLSTKSFSETVDNEPEFTPLDPLDKVPDETKPVESAEDFHESDNKAFSEDYKSYIAVAIYAGQGKAEVVRFRLSAKNQNLARAKAKYDAHNMRKEAKYLEIFDDKDEESAKKYESELEEKLGGKEFSSNSDTKDFEVLGIKISKSKDTDPELIRENINAKNSEEAKDLIRSMIEDGGDLIVHAKAFKVHPSSKKEVDEYEKKLDGMIQSKSFSEEDKYYFVVGLKIANHDHIKPVIIQERIAAMSPSEAKEAIKEVIEAPLGRRSVTEYKFKYVKAFEIPGGSRNAGPGSMKEMHDYLRELEQRISQGNYTFLEVETLKDSDIELDPKSPTLELREMDDELKLKRSLSSKWVGSKLYKKL